MPYQYRISFTVIVEGDGQHSDGNGATATARRLSELLKSDPRVVEVGPFAGPVYRDTRLCTCRTNFRGPCPIHGGVVLPG